MINFDEYYKSPCKKCYLWNLAAIEAGKDKGMCGDCFDKCYVKVDLCQAALHEGE